MNNYKYNKDTIAFDKRLKDVVSKFNRQYNNGKIKTETEYAYKVKEAIIDFYKKLGKPSFELHLAAEVPSLWHYTDMLSKAKFDMETLLIGSQHISDSMMISENELNESIEILSKRTSGILIKVSSIENKIKSQRNSKDIIFTDTFAEDINTHKDDTLEHSSYADTSSGTLTLRPNKNKLVTKGFEAEILNTSNGFPGNTHEVYYSMSNLMNSNIRYKGESDANINLKTILNDDSHNSYFEFEMFNVDDESITLSSNIGFLYKEGISWISNEDVLRLNVKIYNEVPVKCNNFRISGIPKTNSNISNPILRNIVISDDLTQVQTIVLNKEMAEALAVSFNTQFVKSITFEIEQSEGYLTDVCRQYALNVDPTRIPYFVHNDFKDFIQMEIPKEMRKSIEYLGLKYDQKTSSIIYPNTKNENSFISEEYIKSQLFYSNKQMPNFKIQSDVVKAIRYSIGIKNIDVRYRQYLDNGVYVSTSFDSEEPIKSLTLNSDDFIPTIFNNYLKENEDINDFIKYFVSFDVGSTWHRIYPRHKANLGPCTIVVNSNAIVTNRNKNICYVDMLTEPKSFMIKIELKRPVENNEETPIVYSYNVDVSSEEDIW